MNKYDLLSKAVDLSYDGKDKEAWDAVHEADKYADKVDHSYDNLRDAVCLTLTAHKRMTRKKGE